MEIKSLKPPREFAVGWEEKIILKDCARIALTPDEMVTFTTEAGGEYDVVRKDWGFYATPSTNGRLLKFNLRTALVRNRVGQFFILLVEKGKEGLFESYVASERLEVLGWLDDERSLPALLGKSTAEGLA